MSKFFNIDKLFNQVNKIKKIKEIQDKTIDFSLIALFFVSIIFFFNIEIFTFGRETISSYIANGIIELFFSLILGVLVVAVFDYVKQILISKLNLPKTGKFSFSYIWKAYNYLKNIDKNEKNIINKITPHICNINKNEDEIKKNILFKILDNEINNFSKNDYFDYSSNITSIAEYNLNEPLKDSLIKNFVNNFINKTTKNEHIENKEFILKHINLITCKKVRTSVLSSFLIKMKKYQEEDFDLNQELKESEQEIKKIFNLYDNKIENKNSLIRNI